MCESFKNLNLEREIESKFIYQFLFLLNSQKVLSNQPKSQTIATTFSKREKKSFMLQERKSTSSTSSLTPSFRRCSLPSWITQGNPSVFRSSVRPNPCGLYPRCFCSYVNPNTCGGCKLLLLHDGAIISKYSSFQFPVGQESHSVPFQMFQWRRYLKRYHNSINFQSDLLWWFRPPSYDVVQVRSSFSNKNELWSPVLPDPPQIDMTPFFEKKNFFFLPCRKIDVL